jgi:hypothetical protein
VLIVDFLVSEGTPAYEFEATMTDGMIDVVETEYWEIGESRERWGQWAPGVSSEGKADYK